jgi:hypothetical protein
LHLAIEVLKEDKNSDLFSDGIKSHHIREAVRRMQRDGKTGLN